MSNYVTKQKALNVTIELWTWLSQPENASKGKTDWPGWKDKEYHELRYCPLCYYTDQYEEDDCDRHCPYYQCYDTSCTGIEVSYNLWDLSCDKKDWVQSHHYAQQFLAELKAIAASGKVRGIKKASDG